MSDNLLIVFTKNIQPGKVKTRLAASIGDEAALKVYHQLVDITEKASSNVNNCDLHIYYSDEIDDKHWSGESKFIQVDGDLGAKMKQAFEHGFNSGYKCVVGIGSDLPDMESSIIETAFEALAEHNTVFGPAKDGGYYLLGMHKFIPEIFENKPWSTSDLLKLTLDELENLDHSTLLLKQLNDIDTIDDLQDSSIQ